MKSYRNIDELYEFLKSIKTIAEFFERKEPAFDDAYMKEVAEWMMKEGSTEENVLSALKAGERGSVRNFEYGRA